MAPGSVDRDHSQTRATAAALSKPSPTDRLYRIVEEGLCIGCGLCEAVAGPDRVVMAKTSSGYLHPTVVGPLDHETVDVVYDVCPGTRIDGLPQHLVAEDTNVDNVWGPWRRIVRAWAGDPDVRHEGSTGGVLTALGQYLLTSGRVQAVLHVKASVDEPTFGQPVLSLTEADVLEGAGSRYGPTATLTDIYEVLDRELTLAFIGKPCDIAALRNLARHDERVDDLVRYWLTPVCGGFGTPSVTERFVRSLGMETEELTGFRYRGRGCPGPTVATTADRREERHYLDYWGDDESSWTLPWRCRICPDGIGDSADLAVSDTWPGGSPTRQGSVDDPGVNAVVARTVAGQDLLESAAADGALTIDYDITPDDMSIYQPHQMHKKYAVGARFRALGDAGRIVPETNRLRLAELAGELPVSINRYQRDGTARRLAQGKGTEPRPPGPIGSM